jgi:hypothetical protein
MSLEFGFESKYQLSRNKILDLVGNVKYFGEKSTFYEVCICVSQKAPTFIMKTHHLHVAVSIPQERPNKMSRA